MSAEPLRRRAWLAPRMWGLHLFAAAAVAFTIVLGLWQLGVYDTRQADERADIRQAPAVPLDEVIGPDEAFTASADYRPVSVRGTYAARTQQFWVSGRAHDGRDGYWLVAPLLVDTSGGGAGGQSAALLVVRGWSADNGDLPPAPGGRVDVRAVLRPGEARSGTLGESRTTGSIRIPTLVGELPYDLYSGYGILTAQDPAGLADSGTRLAPVAPPAPDTSWTVGWRNLTYAIQWWVFGAFALFMWWRMGSEMVGNAARSSAHGSGQGPAQRGEGDAGAPVGPRTGSSAGSSAGSPAG